MLRTAFMGTPELAVPALRVLARRSDLRLVVTQPDRPAGRGHHLRAPPVKQAAVELGLPTWQPERLGRCEHDALSDLDLVVVMAFGELLGRRCLALPRHGCVNLHASLLPRWRGASPLQAAIRAGDAETGVSVMRMVRRLDAGPVYLREAFPLPQDATLPWLHDRMAACAADALERFLDAFPDVTAEEQDDAAATYCRKLTSDDGHLDFGGDAVELERQVRAYTPAPGCWARHPDGTRLGILAARIAEGHDDVEAGAVRGLDHGAVVGCGRGALALEAVQPAGKRAMTIRDYRNGHLLPERLC